jgi:hypothetical protein
MNLVCFRAWSSSSSGSVALFDVVGSLIGGNDSGWTVKSSACFEGLEGGLNSTLEGFLSIMVSVSEKDKLSVTDDGASLLILLSFLLGVSVSRARAVSSKFLEEVLSFELRRCLLRGLSGGSGMLDSYGRFSIHAKWARKFHSWGQQDGLLSHELTEAGLTHDKLGYFSLLCGLK